MQIQKVNSSLNRSDAILQSQSSDQMAKEIRADLQLMEQMNKSIGFMDYSLKDSQIGNLVNLIELRDKLNNTSNLTSKDTNMIIDRQCAPLSQEVDQDR